MKQKHLFLDNLRSLKKFLTIGLLGALIPAFILTGCSDSDSGGGTTGPTTYSITTSGIEKGTVIASPSSAKAGDRVNLTVTPNDNTYKLKAESLKWKYGDTEAVLSSSPYFFTMPAANVTVTAEFEALPANTYAVTIDTNVKNGTLSANPDSGETGTTITVTATPNEGYKLEANSLKYKTYDSNHTLETTETPITGNSFNLPQYGVQITAKFVSESTLPEGTTQELITKGRNSLKNKDFDAAIDYFEAAYQKDTANKEAAIWSALGKIAGIPKDRAMRDLIETHLGVKGYPNSLDSLITGGWLKSYPEEEEVRGYYDNTNYTWYSWYDYDPGYRSGAKGYYKYSYDTWQYEFVSGEYDPEKGEYYDDGGGYYIHWYTYNPSLRGGTAGYYYYSGSNGAGWGTYEKLGNEKDKDNSYFDPDYGTYVSWYDSDPENGKERGEGYYIHISYLPGWSDYTFVSSTKQYRTSTSSLPELPVPTWFDSTGAYKDSLLHTGAESASTWQMLLYANLLDKNTNGLNTFLDGLLTSVFGGSSSYKQACDRIAALADNDSVTVTVDELKGLGVYDIFEGEVTIGKSELELLAAALRVVKATLEWVDAYDWNTNLNFLKFDWNKEGEFQNKLKALNAADLPLRNNFLKDRNNGKLAESKADYTAAVETAISVYEKILTSAALPQGVKDEMNNNGWIKGGLTALKAALDGSGVFYVPDSVPSGAAWTGSQQNHALGVNMAKIFAPGQFALDKLIDTESGGRSPQFYGFSDSGNAVKITAKSQIQNYDAIGFKLNLAPLKDAVTKAFDDFGDQDISVFPPDIGEILYDLYHK